ncbi:hypothetical protein RRF57_008203 [Xylaria bambusicola]|uniref:Major facilitator superfamily (MFS) profile domain-containing protein n=1 Tax=Xylaria bambusicola TaxID=326684 RepID=A0AAN7UWM1_9PEZI
MLIACQWLIISGLAVQIVPSAVHSISRGDRSGQVKRCILLIYTFKREKVDLYTSLKARSLSATIMERTGPNPNLNFAKGTQPEGHASQRDTNLEKRLNDSDALKNVDPTLETYASIMGTNKPDPWGPGYIRLYLLAATIFLCSTMSGFDSSLMGSINVRSRVSISRPSNACPPH